MKRKQDTSNTAVQDTSSTNQDTPKKSESPEDVSLELFRIMHPSLAIFCLLKKDTEMGTDEYKDVIYRGWKQFPREIARNCTYDKAEMLIQWAVDLDHIDLVEMYFEFAPKRVFSNKNFCWGNIVNLGKRGLYDSLVRLARLPVKHFGKSPDPLEILAEYGPVEYVNLVLALPRYRKNRKCIVDAFASSIRGGTVANVQTLIEHECCQLTVAACQKDKFQKDILSLNDQHNKCGTEKWLEIQKILQKNHKKLTGIECYRLMWL